MFLKATVIIFTAIMLAAPAKAIFTLAQQLVNETSYCVSEAGLCADKII